MKISLLETAQRLLNTGVVAVPTETVYGLAASVSQPAAIDQIFVLKGRPANNPLIIHIAEFKQLEQYVSTLPEGARELAQAFWPGPLTLVLPCDLEQVPSQVRAGLNTAAFRVPNHPMTLELLSITGPLVMPSANLSGRPSATSPEHVEEDFGSEFPVLDGGSCGFGVESTILYYGDEQWQIIRLGALPAEAFEDVLGYIPLFNVSSKEKAPICPGQLYRHYAPKAKLILVENLTECADRECAGVILGFNDRKYPAADRVISLGSSSSPKDVAENLYAVLRYLDQEGIESVLVDMDFPRHGLWLTIEERLKKAASKV
jgi:L-threonylcarbamoyladenylate synthase